METNCKEVQEALLAEPNTRIEKVLSHINECTKCSSFLNEIKQFDDKLKAACNIVVPDGLESRILLAQKMSESQSVNNAKGSYKWMSLAAAIVLSIGISIGVYQLGKSHGVEKEVLAHVYYDLHIMDHDENVSLASFNSLMSEYGIIAEEKIGHIRYATKCPIEKKMVPHFVLDQDGKPINVMYIPWEQTQTRKAFNDDKFAGVRIGSAKGSYVILSEDIELIKGAEEKIMYSMKEIDI